MASILVENEMQQAPQEVRDLFNRTFQDPSSILPYTAEMDSLAQLYIKRAVVSPKYAEDAGHVAICTVARIDYLVSWNFRHLVNVRREAGFNSVNLLQGYQSVRIVSPMELIYGP